jgi:rubrerythrin
MAEPTIKALNELIQLDYDASKTYERALSSIGSKDEVVRADLQAFMEDHLRHIRDLSRLVAELGGRPLDPKRDAKGVLLEVMTKLRGTTGTVGALKAMRTNEKLTNRTYERAVSAGYAPEVQPLIATHLADERRHLAGIEAHILRLTGEGLTIEEEDVLSIDREPPDLGPGARI